MHSFVMATISALIQRRNGPRGSYVSRQPTSLVCAVVKEAT